MIRSLIFPCLLILMAAASPAQAEDVPRFDVGLFCQANAAARGGATNCRRSEEIQRLTLTESWETFPKQRKHFCVQSVSFKPRAQRSYQVLAQCLDEGTIS
jgi:hypothetical protein